MPILNPDHLFDQANGLTARAGRKPRQVDLRRAISAAYYGLFHLTLIAMCDVLVGQNQRGQPRYTLIYRSIDHRALKTLCKAVSRHILGHVPELKYQPYFPSSGFGQNLRDYCSTIVSLQDERHRADYDPSSSFTRASAANFVVQASQARNAFWSADVNERMLFLTLLATPPRDGR